MSKYITVKNPTSFSRYSSLPFIVWFKIFPVSLVSCFLKTMLYSILDLSILTSRLHHLSASRNRYFMYSIPWRNFYIQPRIIKSVGEHCFIEYPWDQKMGWKYEAQPIIVRWNNGDLKNDQNLSALGVASLAPHDSKKCNGKNSFHSHLMNMSECFKLPDFNPDLLDIAIVKSYVSSMKQEYISYWQNTLQHSQKLEFYRSFKTDHTSSSYLDLTRGTAGRRALVKLRISNHKLMIEIGRYNQTTKDNRHCPFCGCNVIEDEWKFTFFFNVLHTVW